MDPIIWFSRIFGEKGDVIEESNRSIGGRLRGAARVTRDRLTGTADVLTGVQSRRQWEGFTDAVTRTVIGIHRDQNELRKAQEELETRHETLRQEFNALNSERNTRSEQLPYSRWLWFAALGVGAIAVVALVLGIIALGRSF